VALILDQVQELKSGTGDGTLSLAAYLINHFHLKLSPDQEFRFQAVLKLRLENQIGQVELQKRLDNPISTGGVGLHKATAEKVVREIEIIMLLKYS
jgi:hypothetical protein